MSGITELNDQAEIFSLSVGLSQAALSLGKIIDDARLSPSEVRNLQWAAQLLGRVDWNSPYYHKSSFSATLACRLRPDFYGKLLEMKFYPSEQYIVKLYETLNSGGKKIMLTDEEMGLTKKLLEGMSGELFCRLTDGRNR